MKSTAYYNQNYDVSIRGLINSIIILPIVFAVFYNIYADKLTAFVLSFAISSFICLFHFNTFIESFVFNCGFAIMIAGFVAFGRDKSRKDIREGQADNTKTFIGIFITILSTGLMVYYLNNYMFGSIIDQPSQGSIFSPSFIAFTSLYIFMYAVILYL